MRVWFRSTCSVATLAVWVTIASGAHATYSVLLSNVETGEQGGAAVSCVGDLDLADIFGYARGDERQVVFFTQGLYSDDVRARVGTWLSEGRSIEDVLGAITDSSADAYAEERQFHFLPNDGAGTTWTGSRTLPFASGRAGQFGPWRYTLAGNILTSEHVLQRAEQSLQTAAGTIEERLVAALEAGAQNSEGDSRCRPLPGDSAYIEVRSAAGVSRLRHSVVNTAPANPLTLLRQAAIAPSPTPAPITAPTTPPQPATTSAAPTNSATPITATPEVATSSTRPSNIAGTSNCAIAPPFGLDGHTRLLSQSALLALTALGLRRIGRRAVGGSRSAT